MQSRSLHPTDAEHKGFGHSPTSILQRKKCFCIDENIACRCRRCIYVCPACGRYETSQHTFQNSKIILRSRPSIFKFHLMRATIFLLRKFSSLQSQQAGRAGTTSQVLNLIFYKSSFKILVGLRPNPMFSKKLRWPCILADAEWANFLGEKFVLWKSALIHPISHQTGTITSGFESKKRN